MKTVLSLAAATLLAAPLCAAPVFEVSFDGDEVGKPPRVSRKPGTDGVYTSPAHISRTEGYDQVIADAHPNMKGHAVLLGPRSALNFIANERDFTPEADYRISLDLLFDAAQTQREHSALRINVYNQEVSHKGFQTSVIFVPKGLMVVGSGTSTISPTPGRSAPR